MTTRRTFCALALTTVAGARAAAQTPPTRSVKELARHTLAGPHAGMEAVLVEIVSPPGSTSAAHRHPGFVLGYVVEGDMRFGIDGRDPQTVPAGGTFFEPAGALHTTATSARPDAATKFLAFMVVPTGSAVTLPA